MDMDLRTPCHYVISPSGNRISVFDAVITLVLMTSSELAIVVSSVAVPISTWPMPKPEAEGRHKTSAELAEMNNFRSKYRKQQPYGPNELDRYLGHVSPLLPLGFMEAASPSPQFESQQLRDYDELVMQDDGGGAIKFQLHSIASKNNVIDTAQDPLCRGPCKCPKDSPHCRTAYTIKDGCDCCHICPRQQGDLCNVRDRCDERRGLYCDMSLAASSTVAIANAPGVPQGLCRAKSGKECQVGGKVYKDGDEFKLNCSLLCTCQNGIYACASLCPQEERVPSAGGHCRDAQLVPVASRCCREWVCPHSHSLPRPEDDFTNAATVKLHSQLATASSLITKKVDGEGNDGSQQCVRENTGWSSCSATCGVGVSIRVRNDNDDCRTVQERRLCLIRPCGLDDKQFLGKECKNTWRHTVTSTALRIEHDGCTSVKQFRPKYCSTCKRQRCCLPDLVKTRQIEMTCNDGRTVSENFMWIKSCRCNEVNCK